MGLWKKLRGKPDQASESSANTGAGPRQPAEDLQNVWFDVLRDPDGNIVAERIQSGGRWWTPEGSEAQTQAFDESEDEL